MDEKGKVLFAFADGCVGACEQGGENTYTAKATIARQGGGKGLLSQFDQPEPRAAQRPLLTGRRDDLGSYLKWSAPDSGGAPIALYKIYRGTVPGNEKYIGKPTGDDLNFVDRSTDPGVASYTYKVTAVNSVGEGLPSNIVALPVTERPDNTAACSLPPAPQSRCTILATTHFPRRKSLPNRELQVRVCVRARCNDFHEGYRPNNSPRHGR